jgi:hypothetical protein
MSSSNSHTHSPAARLANTGGPIKSTNPTYDEVFDLLTIAHSEVETNYGHYLSARHKNHANPLSSASLTQSLLENLKNDQDDCRTLEESPLNILQARLVLERNLIDHWNQFGRHKEGKDPLPDELESFPLRLAADEARILFKQLPPLRPVFEWPPNAQINTPSIPPFSLVEARVQAVLPQAARRISTVQVDAIPEEDYDFSSPALYESQESSPVQVAKESSITSSTKRDNPYNASIVHSVKRTKTSPTSPETSKTPEKSRPRKKGSYSPTYDLLADAPSANIPFPLKGKHPNDVTIVELIAFFPRYLRCTDVIERIVSNGGTCLLIARIINAHRTLQAPAYTNAILKTVQGQMRSLGDQTANGGHDYTGWTVGRHQPATGHDENNLDITNLRRKDQYFRMADNYDSQISFRDLARHVKQFPSGHDALNLTRCVEYAVAHSSEEWDFPDDFERLVEHISDGSTFGVPVTPDHLDRAAWGRWRNAQ